MNRFINIFFAITMTAAAQSDTEGPQLVDLQIITPEVVCGETPGSVRVRATISDNLSGYNYGYIALQNPSVMVNWPTSYTRVDVSLNTRVSGTPTYGVYEGEATMPKYCEIGQWTVNHVWLQDVARNGKTYSTPPGSFRVIGGSATDSVQEYSVFPQVAFGDAWETSFYFLNKGSSLVAFKVDLYDDSGGALQIGSGIANTQTINLQGGGMASLTLPRTGPLRQGYAMTKLPPTVVGYGVFKQSVVGREEKESSLLFQRGLNSTYSFVCDESQGFVTALSIANPNSTSISILIEAIGENGSRLGSKLLTISAKGKIAFVITDLSTAGKRYILKVSNSNGVNSGSLFSILGLRFTPAGSFTAIPIF